MADIKYQNWYQLQKVTPADMDTLSQTLYQLAMGALTATPSPCIIALKGDIPPIGSGSIAMPAGIFRFKDAQLPAMDYVTPIFGEADATTLTGITGNGFIIARYTAAEAPITMLASPKAVNPNSPNPPLSVAASTNPTGAIVTTTYQFVTTVDPVTDCTVCVITSGAISGYGNFLINRAATDAEVTAETSNAVALTPKDIPSIVAQNALEDVYDDVANKAVYIKRKSDGSNIDLIVTGNLTISAGDVNIENGWIAVRGATSSYFGNAIECGQDATDPTHLVRLSQLQTASVPVGTVLWYNGSTAPAGFHIADGTALEDVDETNPALYAWALAEHGDMTEARYYAGEQGRPFLTGTDLTLPSLLDGRFIRATGGNAAALGVLQAAMQAAHQHNAGDGWKFQDDSVSNQATNYGSNGPIITTIMETINMVNTNVAIGEDVFPGNVALLPIIKI